MFAFYLVVSVSDNSRCSYDDKTYTVTVTHNNFDTKCWSDGDRVETIIFTSNVKKISEGIFKDLRYLTSVQFDSNGRFTDIGSSAFEGCTSLSTITLPMTLTKLGSNAFKGCSSLVCVEFLGTKSFNDETVFPDSVKKVIVPSGYNEEKMCGKSVTIQDGSETCDIIADEEEGEVNASDDNVSTGGEEGNGGNDGSDVIDGNNGSDENGGNDGSDVIDGNNGSDENDGNNGSDENGGNNGSDENGGNNGSDENDGNNGSDVIDGNKESTEEDNHEGSIEGNSEISRSEGMDEVEIVLGDDTISNKEQSSSLSIGELVGIVVGSIVGVALIASFIYLTLSKRRQKSLDELSNDISTCVDYHADE